MCRVVSVSEVRSSLRCDQEAEDGHHQPRVHCPTLLEIYSLESISTSAMALIVSPRGLKQLRLGVCKVSTCLWQYCHLEKGESCPALPCASGCQDRSSVRRKYLRSWWVVSGHRGAPHMSRGHRLIEHGDTISQKWYNVYKIIMKILISKCFLSFIIHTAPGVELTCIDPFPEKFSIGGTWHLMKTRAGGRGWWLAWLSRNPLRAARTRDLTLMNGYVTPSQVVHRKMSYK